MNKLKSRLFCKLRESRRWRWGATIVGFIIFWAGFSVWTFKTTKYYAAVTEVYGMPDGVGEPLSWSERNGRANYWKIQKFHKTFILTFVEPYGQIEVMKQHSTAYNMTIFEPTAYIVYDCKKNENKYRSLDTNSFLLMEAFDHLEPVKVTYYGSDGKIHLQMKRNSNDKMEITSFSSEDQPQLLNSILFRVPDGKMVGNDMKSQQIEVTYNPDGWPLTCSLSSGKKNLYGVNGERNTYRDGRLSTLCYLDDEGKAISNNQGVMMIQFHYDEKEGSLQSIRYYSDEKGLKRADGFYGVSIEEFDYDYKSGNLIERIGKNQSENWEYDTNQVYLYKYTYNEKGMLIKEEYEGIDGNPVREKYSQRQQIGFEEYGFLTRKIIRITFDAAAEKTKKKPETLFLLCNWPMSRDMQK